MDGSRRSWHVGCPFKKITTVPAHLDCSGSEGNTRIGNGVAVVGTPGKGDRHVDETGGFVKMIGESTLLGESIAQARQMARGTDGPILLMGEAGTGRELFARGIHYAGPHPGAPFVAMDCRDIPPGLLESDLFGRAASTLPEGVERKPGLAELAGTGTLFLEGIIHLDPELQKAVLRMIEVGTIRSVGAREDRKVHCRLVVTGTRELERAVREGRFSEDLFYRLNLYRVEIPPLRDRTGDIPLLARHFLDELAEERGEEPKELTDDTLEALESHRWPGNVRELRTVLVRAAAATSGPVIRPTDLEVQIRWHHPFVEGGEVPADTIHIPKGGKSLQAVEGEVIQATLELTEGNQSAAARILEISRPTLARKIKQYDLWVPGRDEPRERRRSSA